MECRIIYIMLNNGFESAQPSQQRPTLNDTPLHVRVSLRQPRVRHQAAAQIRLRSSAGIVFRQAAVEVQQQNWHEIRDVNAPGQTRDTHGKSRQRDFWKT